VPTRKVHNPVASSPASRDLGDVVTELTRIIRPRRNIKDRSEDVGRPTVAGLGSTLVAALTARSWT
jgi:hypothetical protein